MKPKFQSVHSLALVLSLLFGYTQPAWSTEILVSIGNLEITDADLEQAMRSSPYTTQFNALGEEDQAALRGGLLQRLVVSRLLFLEAKAKNLENTDQFKEELERFRLGLLHRKYMERIRSGITVPEDVRRRMKEEFKANHDAFKAAESAYISDEYKKARIREIKLLRDKYHVRTFQDRMVPGAAPKSVLMEGDGFRIHTSDLLAGSEKNVTPERIAHQLYIRAELLLTALAAVDAGIDVSGELESFRTERLPALLAERLERDWLPDEKPLNAYFDSHPELGLILARRHIGQIVLATREEAEAVRKRILAGESLFALAGEFSIDPYGRKNRGDMGWIKEDRGSPVINAAIAQLKDGEISEVIETPLGFHLVTILDRKPGESRPYRLVRDKVRQLYLSEKMTSYLQSLEQKYQVVWHVIENRQARN